jgi:hypothetical protein
MSRPARTAIVRSGHGWGQSPAVSRSATVQGQSPAVSREDTE